MTRNADYIIWEACAETKNIEDRDAPCWNDAYASIESPSVLRKAQRALLQCFWLRNHINADCVCDLS